MGKCFNFTRLIKKYEIVVDYTVDGTGYRDPLTGRWIEGATIEETRRMVVLPVDKQTVYESGGRITSANRIIYSLSPLDVRGHIHFESARWTIEQAGDYKTYGDFYRYVAVREAKA